MKTIPLSEVIAAATPLPYLAEEEVLYLENRSDRRMLAVSIPSHTNEEGIATAALLAHSPAALKRCVEALKDIKADCERAMETRNVADMDFACAHAIEYCTKALAAANNVEVSA